MDYAPICLSLLGQTCFFFKAGLRMNNFAEKMARKICLERFRV